MTEQRRETSLIRVVIVALLPALIFSVGVGAFLPLIPAVAEQMGAGLEMAGFIAGAMTIGQTIGNMPAGAFVARFGERTGMLVGSALAVAGILLSALATNQWVLLAGILVIGVAHAVFHLARHAFLTTYAPLKYRARVLSTLGGVYRAGLFVGPLISAAVIAITGVAQSAFWVFVACAVIVVVVLLVVPDVEGMVGRAPSGSRGAESDAAAEPAPESAADEQPASETTPEHASGPAGDLESSQEPEPQHAPAARPSVWAAIREHHTVLLRLGLAAGLVMLLRGARNLILPLWALSIGMDEVSTAIIIGISGGIDFALFFTSGWIMDRFSRIWAAVPTMVGLGVGLLALALTSALPSPETWFIVIAIVLGFANGFGSGIVLTLGADVAPRNAPAPFLAGWHFITDASSAAVPFIVAGVTALAGLPITVAVLGGVGLVGAWMLIRWIPRFVPNGGRGAASSG